MPNLNVCRRAVTLAATAGARPGVNIATDMTVTPAHEAVADLYEQRLQRLIDRLPKVLQPSTRWLRRSSSRWVRVPTGVLLVCGGLLSIFPFFGIWMLPLGLLLLAEDLAPLRRPRDRALDWIARRRPDWFAEKAIVTTTRALPSLRS